MIVELKIETAADSPAQITSSSELDIVAFEVPNMSKFQPPTCVFFIVNFGI